MLGDPALVDPLQVLDELLAGHVALNLVIDRLATIKLSVAFRQVSALLDFFDYHLIVFVEVADLLQVCLPLPPLLLRHLPATLTLLSLQVPLSELSALVAQVAFVLLLKGLSRSLLIQPGRAHC